MKKVCCLIILLAFIFILCPASQITYSQDAPETPPVEPEFKAPKVSPQQKKIDEAVKKGVDALLKRKVGRGSKQIEIIVLTLAHAGVDPQHPTLKGMIETMAKEPLSSVYNVALKAVALELVDRDKYQKEIAECAQALVDYQCVNGQWFYDATFKPSKDEKRNPVLTGTPKIIEVITDSKGGVEKRVTPPTKGYEVKRNNTNRPPVGDNSNTHYALFGLRAAARAGITIPKETWQDAANWWVKGQLPEGGWAYASIVNMPDPKPYGSMTVAGVVGLTIAKCYLGEDYKNDPAIQKGLKWLSDNFTLTKNPGALFWGLPADCWQYYYIYGIERVGAILDIEVMGGHDWYEEGATYLLKHQQRDGIWNQATDDRYGEDMIVDTCFAILFLKRATPTLRTKIVKTGEEGKDKPEEKGTDKKGE